MNSGQGTEARRIVGASGSFLADSAGSGRLSDAAGVGHVQGFGRGHHQGPSLVNQLESFSETIKIKNETLGNMRRELTDKTLLNTIVATTNKSDFLMAEADFKRAELSCQKAFQS